MSAIRPLATIGMLMVLGIFLWTRINTPGLEQSAEAELAIEGAPPLAIEGAPPFGSSTPEAMTSAPPANSSMMDRLASAPPAPASEAPTVEAAAEFSFGPMGGSASESTARTITPLDTTRPGGVPDLPPLPEHVPTADYASPPATDTSRVASNAALEQNGSPTISGRVPELGTQVGSALDYSSSDVPPPPADAIAGQSAPPVPDLPMGGGSEFAPTTSAFAAGRAAIDTALEQGDLERAHLLLTGWYGDSSLTPTERDEVDRLLGQLAGTVVYSAEHRLEPPHTVQAGESLESIAQMYQVPWQLLGKINGIAEPGALQPGQQLKVVRGPFAAVVDVERQEMALMVAERYAGRFTVKTEGTAAGEGEWVVTQKQSPTPGDPSAKHVVLQQTGVAENNTTMVLAPASVNPPNTAGALRVSPQDQDDLFDILSIGSKVIIRK